MSCRPIGMILITLILTSSSGEHGGALPGSETPAKAKPVVTKLEILPGEAEWLRPCHCSLCFLIILNLEPMVGSTEPLRNPRRLTHVHFWKRQSVPRNRPLSRWFPQFSYHVHLGADGRFHGTDKESQAPRNRSRLLCFL